LIGLLSTASGRFYLKHPWQLCLAVTGIALGVAVYVGVDLANDSARRAFELSENLVLGRTTHQLVGLDGSVPNAVYRELRIEHGPVVGAPVVEGQVRLSASPNRRFTLLGVDPLEESGFRGFSGFVPGRGSDLARLIVEPGTVLVPEALAAEFGLANGSNLGLIAGGIVTTVQVVGTIRETTLDPGGINLPIVTDIASAQELLATATVTRVDLVLTAEEAERLTALAIPGVRLLPAASRNATFSEISRAFRLNLTALSLLALLVGVFLIYATMSFAIVQRRQIFGVLRALGVSRRQMLLSILLEAAAIGCAATVLGLVLGHGLAIGLIDLVLRTIGDLYFTATVSAAEPSTLIYWKGLVIGVLTTLLAALAPALEAANTTPDAAMSRAALERTARRYSRSGAWLALPTAALGSLLFVAAPRSLFLGFAGLFCIIVAGALLIPTGTTWLLRLAEPAAERAFGISGSLAVRGVAASLSRTGVAAAALSVAVATVIGVGIMIGSFRVSLAEWLDTTLIADVYLSVPDSASTQNNAFSATRLAAIEALPEVSGISLSRFTELPTLYGELNVRAIRPGPRGWGLTLLDESPADSLPRLTAGEGVMVSEPYAYRRQLEIGDHLVLPTAEGDAAFLILGIFRDYITDGGAVLMPLNVYRRYWSDQGISGVGVYFHDSVDRAPARAAIRSLVAGEPSIRFRSNDMIRARSLEIFDRTFRITEVLRILAGVVAFLGLFSALMSIELERAREVAILRALGMTPRQLGTLALTQTGILGLAAGLLAIPVGIVMAALLVFIINQRSFGWSMGLTLEPAPLLLGIALAFSAALLAGAYPAVRAGQGSVATQLRDE
jgi:putative ABC transport system permease protein